MRVRIALVWELCDGTNLGLRDEVMDIRDEVMDIRDLYQYCLLCGEPLSPTRN